MVKYTRLWETMQRKGISQYRLIKTYGISNGQLNRLRRIIYFDAYRGDFMQNSGLPRGGCDGDRVR